MSATATASPGSQVIGTPLWGSVRIPILGVTGERFSGKTLFLSSIRPQSTLMIDLERSSETYNIPYARRLDLYSELQKQFDGDPKKKGKVPGPIDAFLWFRDVLRSVKTGEFDVIAVDPVSDIEQGMVDWIRANPAEFGRTAAQYQNSVGLLYADVASYWKMELGMLSAKCQTFAFSTHMGFVWKGGKPTEKRKAKGKTVLYELASLYLHLERRPDEKGKMQKEPIGIVIEPLGKCRLAVSKIDEKGEIEHFPFLPPRLSKATPATIREYIANPPDYSKLKKGETVEPRALTPEEKLELEREIAENRRIAEEAKLQQMQLVRTAAELQAQASRPAPSNAAATEEAEATPTEQPAVTSAPPAVTATTEATATTAPPAQPQVPAQSDREQLISLIQSQRNELGIPDAAWEAGLRKRGAENLEDLSDDKLREIQKALWAKLTTRDMENSLRPGE